MSRVGQHAPNDLSLFQCSTHTAHLIGSQTALQLSNQIQRSRSVPLATRRRLRGCRRRRRCLCRRTASHRCTLLPSHFRLPSRRLCRLPPSPSLPTEGNATQLLLEGCCCCSICLRRCLSLLLLRLRLLVLPRCRRRFCPRRSSNPVENRIANSMFSCFF